MARITENTAETGIIREEDFSVIMAQAFATYVLWVVTDRALPDARDGLKPVQRRILSGMREARYLSSRPTVKSAEVVGLILGNYHPHGDASVYDAAVRLAQPFTMRYPLIEGQGNMGSEDGDAPAAYRYTEMRLSPLAEALMADMERDTVPLHPSYKQDPKVVEPDYLPGRIPPIVNPSSGIAVGLSTNIPPHNLTEVLRASRPDSATQPADPVDRSGLVVGAEQTELELTGADGPPEGAEELEGEDGPGVDDCRRHALPALPYGARRHTHDAELRQPLRHVDFDGDVVRLYPEDGSRAYGGKHAGR